ncbi:hypothetical protein [Roseibium sediminicola]|uniref:4Fe-4S ferredoxin-type domain-containing protein n=1 Tax=Roseibium sediminicola TaxID=2933272 RepID=A0ABT0GSK0_9HYPH|nr:hypothetical protein [Roseibium sp. CAU 1639]MCK7612408.1 hypothetical protein [Roseibium sp. CAU 1639]
MTGPAAAELTERLAAAGFLCLGGFEPEPSSLVPPLPGGGAARSLLLIGSTGPSIWRSLSKSPETLDGYADPLDRYTRRVLTEIAATEGFGVVFPFDGPPYHPFQQWAKKCGGFSQSPMGVLAHRDLGPWAGFRAAFLSENPLVTGEGTGAPGPCESCGGKPCINACPANALSEAAGYDVPRCRAHLKADRNADCWSGCLARRACPYGAEHQQGPANARFHMESFIGH